MDLDKLTDQLAIVKTELEVVKVKLDIVTKQLEGITANIKWWVAGTIFPTIAMIGTLIVTKGIK